ncbi:MAG: PilZ domain-containing protein [bacterium]|nr:PilZ domain-containing protein [bacterium]
MKLVENRKYVRKRTFLAAKIYFNDKQSVIDCTVSELTAGGARLRVVSRIGIPDHFILIIPSMEESYICWMVWGEMTEIGVTFTRPKDLVGQPDLRLV